MNDETMIIRTKAEDRKLATRRRRILGVPMVIAAPLAAVLAFGGVALAAILFSMTGAVTAQADNGTTPTIIAEHFTGKFYPGVTRNLKFTVTNPNEFPVAITAVAATGVSDFTPGCAGGSKLSGVATALNQNIAITGVTVPANGTKIVEIENAVKLDASAEAGCGFKINLKVTGSGAGN